MIQQLHKTDQKSPKGRWLQFSRGRDDKNPTYAGDLRGASILTD